MSSPETGVGLRSRALALFSAGRDWEALSVFERAMRGGVRDAEMLRKYGWTCFALGGAPAAEACMREALAAGPEEWESYYALGVTLRGRDDIAAQAALSAAVERSGRNVECLIALSSGALALDDPTQAEQYAREAIGADPCRRLAWMALGAALLAADRLQDAHDAWLHAENLRTNEAPDEQPILDRGLALRLLGRTLDAIGYYEARLPVIPDAIAHGQYALTLLTAGILTPGWEQYEFRWFDPWLASQRAAYDRPAWRGQDLRGATILLRCEQGVGDVLQFIRFAPLVKARGAAVLLELRPGLGALAAAFPAIDAVYEHGKVGYEFDYWCDLMSLPLACGGAAATIPTEVPYLRLDEARRAHWKGRLAGIPQPQIGIVWAGDPRHQRDRQRSIRLDTLRPLFDVPGLSWLSLQKGAASTALRAERLDHLVVDLDPELHDYSDTAAAIDALDLVVTVDTSVAHLAGALGKPVWVLLPKIADWRWLENRNDSPWYPTMRLLRQQNAGDWQGVVARVVDDLAAWRGSGSRTLANSSTLHSPPISDAETSRGSFRDVRADGRSPQLARACYTRAGWMQYQPAAGASARSLEHYGEYLQGETELLTRLVPKDSVIVEARAGLGYHAVTLGRIAGEAGHVLAIEPSEVLRTILRQNIASTGGRGVSVMPGAETRKSIDVLDFERLDVLKIGGSDDARALIEGASATLWRLRPLVFAAQPSREVLDALSARMVDLGFRCWSVATAFFNPTNFNRRTDDIFDGADALALLAIPEERDFDLPPDLSSRMAVVSG